MNYYALIGAMMGSGFGYSLVMGYGAFHGLGMAVIYLVLGVVLAGSLKAGKRIVGRIRDSVA